MPQKSSFPLRYIVLILCIVVWLYEGSQMSSLKEQAAPYISQLQDMDSEGHFAGVMLESFVRGAMGDLFGTANEQADKYSGLKSQLAPIAMEYESAESWSSWAFWIGLLTLCWIWFKFWWFRPRAQ